jgi:thiamine biosynthesis lipoprotein
MVDLLSRALDAVALTGGAFDPTVQPLWDLYARHFAAPDADPAGPDQAARAAALARVNYRAIAVTSRRIALGSGAAVTLNGIAQGYVTDRIAELLRARGFEHVLVDMGEMRALGRRGDGRPWQVGIADPSQPWHALRRLPLKGRALATSGGYGTIFEPSGRHHHLFDPRSGQSVNVHRSVSVVAPDATTADALSTTLAVLPREHGLGLLARFADVGAIFVAADGEIVTAGALTA